MKNQQLQQKQSDEMKDLKEVLIKKMEDQNQKIEQMSNDIQTILNHIEKL